MSLEPLVVPPGGPLVLMLVGWLVCRGGGTGRRRTGRALVVLGFLSLYLTSTPFVARRLSHSLQVHPAWDGERGELAALVVLGADIAGPTPELGGVTLGPLSLQRARWAATVHERTGLPVLVTGASLRGGTPSVAELLRRTLEDEFGVPVRWVDSQAENTRQNAERSAQLLADQGIRHVGLVTHATHMRRAAHFFEAQGLVVVPMPTAFRGGPTPLPGSLLPSSRALRESALACHEWGGLLWGRLSGWGAP